MDDPELKAMGTVYEALEGLDEDARARVVNWVSSRFSLPAVRTQRDSGVGSETPRRNGGATVSDFSSVADVFAAANPKNTADRALLVAAFVQKSPSGSDVRGRDVNEQLRHLGHGVKNITRALESLMNANPHLLIQTRKDGKSRQAKKLYKVTQAGFSRVQALLSGSDGEPE